MNDMPSSRLLYSAAVWLGILVGQAWAAEWPNPVANDVLPAPTSGLTHGPMLGRPTSDSVRVWVRTDRPRGFDVIYDTQPPLTADSPTVHGTTSAATDNTGTVDILGLTADTRYVYGIRIDGQLVDTRVDFRDPWPSFRTLPDASTARDETLNPEGLTNLCFAIGHCMSQEPGPRSGGHYASAPAFDTLLARHGDEPRFMIINGDIIYEERRDGTLDGVRENYRLYFERGRSFSRRGRRLPLLFTFDDHDVGWDIHGCGEVGLGEGRHLMRDIGLAAYGDYAGWANPAMASRGEIRFGTASMQEGSDLLVDEGAAFADLDPATVSTIHVGTYTRPDSGWKRPETGDAAKPPPNAGVYALIEVVDAHRLRVRPAFTTTGTAAHVSTKPGADQDDKGDGFPSFLHQRERLLTALEQVGKPVLIFSGDMHHVASIRITANIWEFLCGPLASTGHPLATLGNPPTGGSWESMGRSVDVRWLSGFPNDLPYQRIRNAYYGLVQVNNAAQVGRPEETGLRLAAFDRPSVTVRWHDAYTGRLVYAETVSRLDR